MPMHAPFSFLLVSQDPFISRAIVDGLFSRGHDVILARSVDQASDMLLARRWSAIVLDALDDPKRLAVFLGRLEQMEPDQRVPALLLGPRSRVAELPPELASVSLPMLPTASWSAMDLVARLEELSGARSQRSSLLSRERSWLEGESSFEAPCPSRQDSLRAIVMLAIARETGCFRRILNDFVCELRLVKGAIVSADSPENDDILGQKCIEAGLIDEGRLTILLREPSTVPLGTRLVRAGLLRPADVRQLLRAQARNRVLSILRKDGGRMEWRPEPAREADPLMIVLSTYSLAWEVARRIPPWCLGAISARPTPSRHLGLVAPELPLTDQQLAFLATLDGRRTVAQAAVATNFDMKAALTLCPRLVAVAALDDPDGETIRAAPEYPLRKSPSRGVKERENQISRAYRARDWEQVVRLCEPILHNEGASPNVPCWLARARLHLGATPASVADLLYDALAKDPEFSVAHRILGRILGELGYEDLGQHHEQLHRLGRA